MNALVIMAEVFKEFGQQQMERCSGFDFSEAYDDTSLSASLFPCLSDIVFKVDANF